MTPKKVDPLLQRLRDRRKDLRLPLRVVAEKTGYDHNCMWHWETGRAMPSLRKVQDWAQALGMKLTLENAGDGDE